MRQNRVHLMPPMSNFYARICVKATPSSNNGLCPEWQSGVTATITDTQILVAGGKTPREIAAFLENLKEADDLATVQQKLI